MAAIQERVVHVDGVRTFYRRVDGPGPPAVFVHGNPTHSEDWLPFLERIDGHAIAPDLPGWGFSEAPDEFDYTMHGLADFLTRFLATLGIADHSLVVHDWGALALIAAQRDPRFVRRLVVINAVPLLPGYRWHWVARRFWRRPLLGELANATTTRAGLRLGLRQATTLRGGVPKKFLEMLWRGRRPGTWPQMLELYRAADEERLADAGAQLDQLTCPALVAWGTADPYLPARFGRAYAERLPRAELVELERGGHWPWLEHPELVARACAFLAG
jgi:pimeloyl-ACP methyl ester carboxylesterase